MVSKTLSTAARLLFLAILVNKVVASNDWSQPCFFGECEYDLPETDEGPSGTLKIWGASEAIGDITPAGGWEILGCTPDDLEQEVRVVCLPDRDDDCLHLFSGAGPAGKLARLPEDCGKGAFALIANFQPSDDQSVPDTLVRRDGTVPPVQALHFSPSFSDPPTRGRTSGDPVPEYEVQFAIQAANIPGAAGDIPVPVGLGRRDGDHDLASREMFERSVSAISELHKRWSIGATKNIPLIDISRNWTPLDVSRQCPSSAFAARIRVDVAAHAKASVAVGFSASGTILPPKVKKFILISALSADLGGSITLTAGFDGRIDTGKIKLYEVAFAGINFPGIFTLGPTFAINAQVQALLAVNLVAMVGVNYKIDNVEFTFPVTSQTGTYGISDTPFKLSASAAVDATGTVEAHLSPSLTVGLRAFGGSVSASVNLDLDGAAYLNLQLNANAQASNKVSTISTDSTHDSRLVRRGTTAPGYHYFNREVEFEERAIAARAGASGCIDLDAAFNVNVGANANFFGLFNPSKVWPLYNRRWDLYAKCFSAATSTKGQIIKGDFDFPAISIKNRSALHERGILDQVCGLSSSIQPQSITDLTISASTMRVK